jgi:hypothetical protein
MIIGNIKNENFLFNADHIEHKVNLLLILFDLRGNGKINIVEVMMMIQTLFCASSKVFPKAKFFQNPSIIQEIKPVIMSLFS